MSLRDRVPLTAVLPDIPDDEDKLDFAPYANTMRDIILGERTETPLTIGIFGSWGSGKTTLMGLIEAGLIAESERLEEARVRLKADEAALKDREAALDEDPSEEELADLEKERERLKREQERLAPRRVIHPVWFNAWLYSKETTLWRALIAQVVAGVRNMPIPEWVGDEATRQKLQRDKGRELDDLAAQLYRVAGPTELGTLSIGTASLLDPEASNRDSAQLTLTLLEGLDLLDNVVNDPEGESEEEAERSRPARLRNYVQQATAQMEQRRVESLEAFRRQFRQIIKEYVIEYGYLVVFVDDLDRCLPEKAVEVLEAIKLFLDVEGCIFVLGIDRDVVERGIRLRYGELAGARAGSIAPFLLGRDSLGPDSGTDKIDAARYRAFMNELLRPDEDTIDGGRYLEKIIQIPFVLPPISRDAMGAFIGKLAPDLPHIECGNVLASGLEPNPRQVKRAINIFTLLWTLAQNKPELQELITPVRLAKLVVLQQRHPELYELLRKTPQQLIQWETYFRQAVDAQGFARWERELGRPTTNRLALPSELEVYEQQDALRSLLLLHPLTGPLAEGSNFVELTPEDATTYVFLTRSIRESVAAPGPASSPPPEMVVDVPVAGDFSVEEVVPLEAEGSEPGVVTRSLDPAIQPKGIVIPTSARVGFDLDEGRLGFLKERAYQAMAYVNNSDDKAAALQTLAEAGAEIHLQVTQGTGTGGYGPGDSDLDEATEIHIPATAHALPWEILYDRPLSGVSLVTRQSRGPSDRRLNVDPDGFWGLRHVVRRPLTTGTGDGGPGSDIIYQEKPRILLALGRARSTPVRRRLEAWSGQGRIDLTLATTLDDTRQALLEEQPDIVVFHAAGQSTRGEIGLEFGHELLTRRELAAWGGRTGTGTGPGAAPGRPPGTALFLFDVGDCVARKSEWPIWLASLRWLGAGAVIAPLELTNGPFSGRFIATVLDEAMKGEPLGEVMVTARQTRLKKDDSPLGLYFVHFGRPEQRLVLAEPPLE